MKDIIPFKKEIIFDTNINEITSISLENTLSITNNNLNGEFIINGYYKVAADNEPISFSKSIPFEMIIDDYDTSEAVIDIDDFYYEVKKDKILFISIDILLDRLKKVELREDDSIEEVTKTINNVFNDSDFKTETYVEYNVYILRDGDTIDTILYRYSTTLDDLKKYNVLDDLKVGDKIIIPNCDEGN